MEKIHQGIAKRLEQEGLDYAAKPGGIYNTRQAQELAKWIDLRYPQHDARKIFYRAFLVENLNLGQTELLLDYVATQGLPRFEAAEVLQKKKMKEAVDQDWGRAMSMGVRSIPSFLANQTLMVGAQSEEKMLEFYRYASNRPS